ncbi:Na+/H+ antiporter NhaC family protein [Pseudodesulfovibrio sp. zrk46]|uniref:Na+/H+ antiporter NhaC family protein n=1 Tax=Pseudodesulfovibrio sp. zrk46 TaxID=2725288 RepID=UPI00144911EA|nr:Na+/H+ antiporter NhaC family protein [Pseudodesulfovibrio sp. zrk46]QJB57278.1 Na+/H+ antiporter NhaC family protein [Pseudodesulfovibrio sp. zrk46]
MKHENPSNGLALLPLVIFLALFVGTGAMLTAQGVSMAFYQLSATVAILPGIAFALFMGREKLDKKINIFLAGVGDNSIVTMCMIYLLAGGFASVAKAIGGVDATVNLGLSFIPVELVLPGLFAIAAFVATAMGTSMGTVAAIAPIAAGIGQQTDISAALLMGTVVGGAMFGDNLSMISDTTIAATRTQGCAMSDKFKMNVRLVAPAAVATLLLLGFTGTAGNISNVGDWEFLRVVPYLVILGLAIAGINVFIVLASGIILAGGVGLAALPDYSLIKFSQDIFTGFTGMHEILVLSMLVGGLGELIRYNGGLKWLLEKVNKLAHKAAKGNKRRSGEFGIASLVALADLCTANNTVAIILTGNLAREIATDADVDPRRSASLLDIFSCIVQGITPYAAQVLLAGSIAGISPVAVGFNNWYCLVLAGVSVVAIMTGWPAAKPNKK